MPSLTSPQHHASNDEPDLSPLAIVLSVLFMGCGALVLAIGYQFESDAYAELLGSVGTRPLVAGYPITTAQALALGLGGAKVGMVFFAQLMKAKAPFLHVRVWTLRATFISLSLFATLLIVSTNTVSPNFTSVLADAKAQITAEYADGQTAIDRDYTDALAITNTSFASAKASENARHAQEIKRLDTALDAERVSGIGPRFRALQTDKAAEQSRHLAELKRLRDAMKAEAGLAADARAAALKVLADDRSDKMAAIDHDALADSVDAQNPSVQRSGRVIAHILPDGYEVSALALTITVVVLLSLAVEFAPLFIFGMSFGLLLGPSPAQTAAPRRRQGQADDATHDDNVVQDHHAPDLPFKRRYSPEINETVQ